MSHRLAIPLLGAIGLSTLGGCSKDSAGDLFAGNWVGTATDAAGVAVPMLAAFTYDAEATPSFSGSLQHADYLYNLNGIVTKDGVATITAVAALRYIEMTDATVEEETTMSGSMVVDVCYGLDTTGLDPAACKLPGTFTMEKQ